MWDITEADIYGRQQEPKGLVEVFINQISCNVSQSLPNIEENLALLDVYNSTNYQGSSGAQGDSKVRQNLRNAKAAASHNVRRNYGRGANGARRNRIIKTQGKVLSKDGNIKAKKQAENDADSEDVSADEEKSAHQPRNVRFADD